ncbi:MAG TPA: RDD family protein [Actinomycetes bacterium]|nr:RDD family protein [Actinomycetes bacterium]
MPEPPDQEAQPTGGARRALASWLSGPYQSVGSDTTQDYRGQRLGLPATGSGSVAGIGRRLTALVVDWLACRLIAVGLLSLSEWWVPAIFAIEYVVLVSTLGSTLGMRLVGIRVSALGGGGPGPLGIVVRTILLMLVVPAVVYDRDTRGLHDRATGTVVVRR